MIPFRLAAVCFALSIGCAFAAENEIPKPRLEQTNDFRVVQHTAAELAMSDDFGSVQWFRWQEELLAKEPMSEMLVAKDFAGLLRVQGIVFATGCMRLTQPELPDIVRQLQKAGHSTLLLSARGIEFRD